LNSINFTQTFREQFTCKKLLLKSNRSKEKLAKPTFKYSYKKAKEKYQFFSLFYFTKTATKKQFV